MSNIPIEERSAAGRHASSPRLAIALRGEPNGPVLRATPVPPAYMIDLFAEMWRDGCLRRGLTSVAFESLQHRVLPVFAENAESGGGCAAFEVETWGPHVDPFLRRFGASAFAEVAAQCARELVAEGSLQQLDRYHYELVAGGSHAAAPDDGQDRLGPTTATGSGSAAWMSVPLAPLADGARQVGEVAQDAFPVFYTERTLQEAEVFSRRGAAAHPPRETGCVLVGPVCTCPDTGEMFVVVTDVLQASAAEEKLHSLVYSGVTWRTMQTIVAAIQAEEQSPAFRIVGQAHGHNFLPAGGAPPCEVCHQANLCGRTSVFVSVDDRVWSQAVFSRQPWVLCHIFGMNARNEPVHSLYTLSQNQFAPRGFRVIEAFKTRRSGC